MNIFITGIGGFIACNLGRYLAGCGHSVLGTVRNPARLSPGHKWLKKGFVYRLGDPPDTKMFDGVDALIHLVHDSRPGSSEINIRGTQELCLSARNGGVSRQIFVSSYSARRDAVSEYGKTKYALESFFRDGNEIIIRPGLVLGNGGLFKRMAGLVRKFPVLPLLDGGKRPVPVIDIGTLCKAVSTILGYEMESAREFNLFHQELVSLRYLLKQVRLITGRKTVFVNVPSGLLLIPLTLLQKIGIKTPISADNLKGYIVNKDDTYFSNLGDVLPEVPSVDAMIRASTEQIIEDSPCR